MARPVLIRRMSPHARPLVKTSKWLSFKNNVERDIFQALRPCPRGSGKETVNDIVDEFCNSVWWACRYLDKAIVNAPWILVRVTFGKRSIKNFRLRINLPGSATMRWMPQTSHHQGPRVVLQIGHSAKIKDYAAKWGVVSSVYAKRYGLSPRGHGIAFPANSGDVQILFGYVQNLSHSLQRLASWALAYD